MEERQAGEDDGRPSDGKGGRGPRAGRLVKEELRDGGGGGGGGGDAEDGTGTEAVSERA